MSLFFASLLVLLFFAGSALFSGLETGGYLVNRIRLRHRVRCNQHAAHRLQTVLDDAPRFIFTVLIGNNLANYLLSRQVTQMYLQGDSGGSGQLFGFIPWNAETAATLTLMLPVFLFAELLPKNLFRRFADQLMYRFSGFLCVCVYLFRPLTIPLTLLFRLLNARRAASETWSSFSFSVEGLRDYFSETVHQDVLSDHQHGMINNLVAMSRVTVREMMTSPPAALSEKASVREALDMLQTRDTEVVTVYRGSPRRLTGFITLFDLMDPSLDPAAPLRSLSRRLLRLRADLSLTGAFRRLRTSSETLAAVTDRNGRSVGLLQLRDIARYIITHP